MSFESFLSTEKIYDGKVVGLRVDSVALPNGRTALREVVDHRDAVVVVPIDVDGYVVLVRQYRYPVGVDLLEAPAGMVEESESPHECARRELQEEIGFSAKSMRCMGKFWTTPGVCNELMHTFIARELFPSILEPDPDEHITVERFPVMDTPDLIRSGEIQDGKTIAALLMAIYLGFHD